VTLKIVATRERIHIAQPFRNGRLLRELRKGNDEIPHVSDVEMFLRKSTLIAENLLLTERGGAFDRLRQHHLVEAFLLKDGVYERREAVETICCAES
jgi:hypothetical protein